MADQMAASGDPNPFAPAEDASPEEVAAFQERMARMMTPDDKITTWVDVSDVIDEKWAAINRHVTQMSPDSFFLRGGLESWRKFWGKEAFILRQARIAVDL